MILLSIFDIFLIATAAGITLVALPVVFFYIRTKHFRKHCDDGWRVRIYHNEEKCYGVIQRRLGDQCYIEYWDPKNQKLHRYFHIDNVFPC